MVHYIALTLDPVQNQKAAVDTHNPSVTLKWDPPANCIYAQYITTYQICFDGWMYSYTSYKYLGYCFCDQLPVKKIYLMFTALTPEPVQNLTAAVDSHKPSVTLKWDPPANAGCAGDVTTYQIRFWDKKNCCYNEKTVNASTTTTVIIRESGLRPLTETTFEVRACSGDDVSPVWRTASTFVGRY